MYYYIKGKLVQKCENFAVIDANGIGYQLYMSSHSLAQLGAEGDIATVWCYLYVKEDIMELYGFSSQEEKAMFLQLISISGIGCKSAVSVLCIAPPEQLAMAILEKNYKLLQKAQGIGEKAARRIVLELSDKLKNLNFTAVVSDSAYDFPVTENDSRSEALSALIVLGYSDNEAKAVLKSIDPSLGTEEIIKQALKKMM